MTSVTSYYISRYLLQLSSQSLTKHYTTSPRCFVLLSSLTLWENSWKKSLERDYNIILLHLILFILINWVDLNSVQLPMQILFSLILFTQNRSKISKQVLWSLTSSSFSLCLIISFSLWSQIKLASIPEFHWSFLIIW